MLKTISSGWVKPRLAMWFRLSFVTFIFSDIPKCSDGKVGILAVRPDLPFGLADSCDCIYLAAK